MQRIAIEAKLKTPIYAAFFPAKSDLGAFSIY
jgi:hypothetical protein